MLLRNHPALNATKEDFQLKLERLEKTLASNAQPVMLETKKPVPRLAILSHQAFLLLMELPQDANKAIIVWAKLPVLRNANQDLMPQLKDRRLV